MKFGEKYELLESVAAGPVETFVAKDVRRGESVLVHILDCGEQKPNQPTVQWVMEAFRRVAPEPAGLVLEAGRYSGTFYAYLVTQLPEEAVLRKWVERYKVQTEETQEVVRPLPVSKESEAPTADLAASEPERPPGTFTRAFIGYGLQPDAAPEASPPQSSIAPAPRPGSAISADLLGPRTDPYRDASRPTRSGAEVPSPAGSFRSDFKATRVPGEEIGPVMKENSPKPAEFTSFWQGPFAGGQPSEMAAPSTQPPPPKAVGEFTRTFGPMTNWEEQASGSGTSGINALPDKPGTFTSTFVDLDRPPKAPGNLESNVPIGSGTVGGTSQAVREPARESAPIVPIPPAAVVAPIPAVPEREIRPLAVGPVSSSSEGATQVFRMPSAQPEVSKPPIPSGPGEYTRIISAVKSGATAQEPSGAEAQNSSGAKPAAAIPAASLPKLPAMAPPAPPPLPAFTPPPLPAPAIPAPAAPKVAAPKVAAPKPPQPPMSYWPLVLTLTVLFLLAALLVVYLVLKH